MKKYKIIRRLFDVFAGQKQGMTMMKKWIFILGLFASFNANAWEPCGTDANGNTIGTLTDRIEHTAYFVVPAEYDGLVMFVYVADDSDAPFSEYEENDVAEYSPPVQFGAPGSDEYLEDYRFYAIREIR